MKWVSGLALVLSIGSIIASGHSIRYEFNAQLPCQAVIDPETGDIIFIGNCTTATTATTSTATTSTATTSTATTSTATTSTATTSTATTSTATTSTATTSTATTSTATTSTATTSTATTSTSTSTTATDATTDGTTGANTDSGDDDDDDDEGDPVFKVNSILYATATKVRNYSTSYYGGSTATLLPKGWVREPGPGEMKANPFIMPVGSSLTADVNYDFTFEVPENGDDRYDISSYGSLTYQSAKRTDRGSGLTAQLQNINTNNNWTGAVGVHSTYNTTWNATDSVTSHTDSEPGSTQGTLYTTLKAPLSGGTYAQPTIKRMNFVCTKASGGTTTPNTSDAMWNSLAAIANFGGNPGNTWGSNPDIIWLLLDTPSRKGDCDDWSFLLRQCLGLLGISSGVEYVHASETRNDVLTIDSKPYTDENGNPRTKYLIMDFYTSGTNHDWNAYEGCCHVNSDGYDSWYAVTPKKHADTAPDMFGLLSFRQYWVLTNNDAIPGVGFNWTVQQVLSELPKP